MEFRVARTARGSSGNLRLRGCDCGVAANYFSAIHRLQPHEISAHWRESQSAPLEVRSAWRSRSRSCRLLPRSHAHPASRRNDYFHLQPGGSNHAYQQRIGRPARFLHDHFHLTADELDAHLYEFREKDAVRHVFRVASSLDSMVVARRRYSPGERSLRHRARRRLGPGTARPAFTRAFAVAKRVRTETAVGSSSVSIASVAVELAKKIFGTLQARMFLSWARAR